MSVITLFEGVLVTIIDGFDARQRVSRDRSPSPLGFIALGPVRGRRGSRIPEPLWAVAVALARRHGVHKISQALRLDYYSLKKRLEATAPVRAGGGERFIEIPLPGTAAVLELEDGSGATLRLELQRVATEELTGLVRSVWSQPR